MRLLALIALVLLCGCRPEQRLTSECVDSQGACPPCAGDGDCVVLGNPCLETAACVPRDAGFAVIAIGCEEWREYRVPPADRCRCVEQTCRAVD